MKKAELIERVAETAEVSKGDADKVIAAMFSTIADHIGSSEDKVTIPGWISFQQTTRAARKGRNPRTGEEIEIAASKGVKITAGSKLKEAAKG